MEKGKKFQTTVYTSFKWKKKSTHTVEFEHVGRYQRAHSTEKWNFKLLMTTPCTNSQYSIHGPSFVKGFHCSLEPGVKQEQSGNTKNKNDTSLLIFPEVYLAQLVGRFSILNQLWFFKPISNHTLCGYLLREYRGWKIKSQI